MVVYFDFSVNQAEEQSDQKTDCYFNDVLYNNRPRQVSPKPIQYEHKGKVKRPSGRLKNPEQMMLLFQADQCINFPFFLLLLNTISNFLKAVMRFTAQKALLC